MKTSKFVAGLVILGLAVLILIGMVKFASVLGFLMFYPYIVQQVAGYGLNQYLAQAIGVVVGAALWFVVLKLFFAWREKKRMLGFGILIGFYVLHLLVMFILPGDALVHPMTGERQFCAVNKLTGRIERFETEQFDRFGEKAKECTLDQIEKFEREKLFAEGENLEVPLGTVRKGFISPVTGAPLFYFCEDASNLPHFYVASGYCPWGDQLQAVTKEVLQKYEKIKSEAAVVSLPTTPIVTVQEKEAVPEKGWFWGFRERTETEVLFWVLCVMAVVGLLIPCSNMLFGCASDAAGLVGTVMSVGVWLFLCVLYANCALFLLETETPQAIAYVLTVFVHTVSLYAYALIVKALFDLQY
ncbi:hypothetical protein A2482_01285 [Candidatus Falkowbacteria bacterium RIFOXYC2_FULL_48_21]|uniref:Uncharacterized protein n=1 Tax=Candidatus Falkowbacteria bacterium RIFOXYC2_FULL_48_21 TaxID=1798005 RepID=A0A1F5T7S9_9BACT|nr:MAG: hypothetical protein A2482_01285 [Candidatus Falkowbacteria bacterium RIFOXYC2_FULL_48_21]